MNRTEKLDLYESSLHTANDDAVWKALGRFPGRSLQAFETGGDQALSAMFGRSSGIRRDCGEVLDFVQDQLESFNVYSHVFEAAHRSAFHEFVNTFFRDTHDLGAVYVKRGWESLGKSWQLDLMGETKRIGKVHSEELQFFEQCEKDFGISFRSPKVRFHRDGDFHCESFSRKLRGAGGIDEHRAAMFEDGDPDLAKFRRGESPSIARFRRTDSSQAYDCPMATFARWTSQDMCVLSFIFDASLESRRVTGLICEQRGSFQPLPYFATCGTKNALLWREIVANLDSDG